MSKALFLTGLGVLQFTAPEKFGDYYFTYSIISTSVFGFIADEDILCQSQPIRVCIEMEFSCFDFCSLLTLRLGLPL